MTSTIYAMSAAAAVVVGAMGGQMMPANTAQAPRPVPVATLPPVGVKSPVLSRSDQQRLREALDKAAAHGLPSYATQGMDALLSSSDETLQRRGQTLLKAAVVRYAYALRHGRLRAADFDDDWGLHPDEFDAAGALETALAAGKVGLWLDALEPAHPGYHNLVKALATYRGIASRGGWERIADGKALRQGMRDPRIADLRRRLAAEDPTISPGVNSNLAMDAALTEALKRFQRRHGLTDDGELGKPTLAALNVPVEDRIGQIEANMERWRWMPAQLPEDRIQVNIAAAQVAVFRNGERTLEMKAAPGRPTDRTPILISAIRGLVINPPWNIPDSIAKKEILPKAQADPGYLEREDIHWVSGANGQRLQQKAGPKSALGQIKFDFDNTYGVYLHDTPSPAAFERSGRLVSHGCVRLEKPRELAALLLAGQGDWSSDLIAAKIEQGDTQRVALIHAMPVMLLYWTAFTGGDGEVHFVKDAYGWDHELLQRISEQKNSNA